MPPKRVSMTMDQKRQIQVHVQRNPTIKYFQLKEWARKHSKVELSSTTAHRIRNAPDTAFLAAPGRKKRRRVRFPAFEAAMLAFYNLNEGKAILTDELMQEEARNIRDKQGLTEKDIMVSNGWLHKFKIRHGIKQYILHGEADSVDRGQLAVDRVELKELIGQYDAQNVFNFDESALFFRLAPNKTLASSRRSGKKSDKDRITVAMCCNMDGTEKQDIVVIGKAKEPRPFRQVKISKMPFKYYNNSTAWQNRVTFTHWLREFDAKMHGRRVLLLLDNASCHNVAHKCLNVVVKFLPPNMTSHVQPLDAGIIRSFKARYRRRYVRWLVDSLHAGVTRKLNILEAIQFSIASWDDVPAQVIRNCWVKCDIIDAVGVARLSQLNDYAPVAESVEVELAGLIAGMNCTVSADDYIDVDADEPTESGAMEVERVSSETSDQESDCEDPIRPSEALASCLRLQSYLAQHHDSQDISKKLASLTAFVRKEVQHRRTQSTIDSYFRENTD